jgi:hypothetical protein
MSYDTASPQPPSAQRSAPAPRSSASSEPTGRLPRCCHKHEDWATLGEHLTADFPTIPAGDVLRDLAEARWVTERFGLGPEDSLDISELIVRHQLMLLTGELPDVAHLDPQSHARRSDDADAGAR